MFLSATQELWAALNPRARAYLVVAQSPLATRLYDQRAFDGEELVVLGYSLFAHRVAKGYQNLHYAVVSHVDDVPVENLAHLVCTLRDAPGPYVTLRMAGSYQTVVFRRDELFDSTEEILADEGIRNQCSESLREIWTGSP